MANNKAFTSSPYAAFKVGKKGELTKVSLPHITELIKRDVQFITDMVNWELSSDTPLKAYLNYGGKVSKCNELGRILGFYMDLETVKNFITGSSGMSRYDKLFNDRLFREVTSWAERFKAANGTSDKFVSQGWKRTANDSKPGYLVPEYHLSATDKQFAYITNDAFADGEIHLRMVIDGVWHELYFPFDSDRFSDASKVTLPNVRVLNNGCLEFTFTAEYEYHYRAFSEQYIVGVDVGRTSYATVVVWDTKNGCIVHTYSMSQRARSMQNSITATQKQLSYLHRKYGCEYPEIPLQRQSLSRKRRELAIVVAQEIADIADVWDNAIIVVEDLSFVKNTMQNGRWSRGELVRWLNHYHELNGGRVLKVNAWNTSQECPYCHEKVTHPKWKESYCAHCDVLMDRDIAASAVIAQRCIASVKQSITTRKKSQKFTTQRTRRSPVVRDTLKYPRRDRTKNHPTPARKKAHKKAVINDNVPLTSLPKNQCSAYHNDDGRVYVDDMHYGTVRTLKKQHDNDSAKLLL